MADLADRNGVEMDLSVARELDSWDAQQAALYVRQEVGEDASERFHHAVFDALWEDGRDVGTPAVLATVAESVGVTGEAVRRAVGDDDLSARFERARQDGIGAVPTFVYDDHAAKGAIPPALLRRLVQGT